MALGWRRGYLRYKDYFLNIYSVYQKKPELKMFMEILLTLITVSFFLAFALRPTALAIVELTSEIEQKEETVEKMDTKIENIEIAQDLYFSLLPSIQLLDSAVPSIAAPEKFVRQVEGLAINSGVTILGFSLGDAVLLGTLPEKRPVDRDLEPLPEGAVGLSFSLSMTGSYSSLSTFITNLTQMRRPPKIDTFSINATDTGGETILVLIVTGRVPYTGEVSE